MTANNKTSIFINTQMPGFIRESDPNLMAFIEAYYEYLEQSNTTLSQGKAIERAQSLRQNYDIDTTQLNDFSEALYNQFLTFLPKNTMASRSLILKNAKDFYRSRGTEKSFRFLFRALYGKEIQIIKPKDDILIASAGTWFVEKSIRINNILVNNVSKTDLASLELFVNSEITGLTSKATAGVNRVLITFDGGIQKYELFLSDPVGSFTNGEQISAIDANGEQLLATILSGSLSSITITNPGTGYNVGEPLVFNSNSGSGAAASISSVSTAGLTSIIRIFGGAGFLVNDQIIVSGGGGSGANGKVTSLDGVANSYFHPNTYNIMCDIIQPYYNTFINSANYMFPNYANANINTTLANALSTFNYGLTGPIQTVLLINPGAGYSGQPSIDASGNTLIKSLGILGRMNIVSPGLNYANGDYLTFKNAPMGSGFGANAIVTLINANGAIQHVQFIPVNGYITGGSGYDPFHLPSVTITSANGVGANIQVTALLATGIPEVSFGASLSNAGQILAITITSTGVGYNVAPTIDLTGSGDGKAQAFCNIISGTFTYPGRYLDDSGFLSSSKVLQDRDYYQNWSYVIRVAESINNYTKVIKELVHPLGYKLWGQYDLVEEVAQNVPFSIVQSNITLNIS